MQVFFLGGSDDAGRRGILAWDSPGSPMRQQAVYCKPLVCDTLHANRKTPLPGNRAGDALLDRRKYMKSSTLALESRGFVNEETLHPNPGIDDAALISGLSSAIPRERTRAAMIIGQQSRSALIPELIRALSRESKLYSKIAIANALGSFCGG